MTITKEDENEFTIKANQEDVNLLYMAIKGNRRMMDIFIGDTSKELQEKSLKAEKQILGFNSNKDLVAVMIEQYKKLKL